MIALCHLKTKDTFDNSSGKYDERWFIDRMNKTFHVSVPQNNVSYESYLFYHDDIDDSLIPVEHFNKLPDPLLLQCYQYTDQWGNEWVAGIVIEEITRELLYEIWLKNGKAIAYEMYGD